ncbi:FKBP-type peptidyl-prolyl cis-trans isomerase [Arsukibacterium indicum]|uniref:Peptidyl-prolyl cis-trans isomerase n=1 Tax=Arsukibacterium indicum TaxID=2848612 RepID=A0ABS6MPE7_9GAMM|nr:peptidylprolyl isomerase [Arsukibacterium indicum]MBV2130658.1 peptidylprolyl isomerase [Arsukibacterium indicum]
MTISQDKVVAMHYTVTDPQGNKLDSSVDGEPLVFLYGHGALIPGLEQALAGKTSGDTFTATIAPADAYGERHDQLVQSVPKSMFDGMDVAPGMRFRAAGPDGREQSVIILEVSEEEVVVDGNHPLSGIELSFDVEVLKVRDATEEELAHGHVHGIDGNESH